MTTYSLRINVSTNVADPAMCADALRSLVQKGDVLDPLIRSFESPDLGLTATIDSIEFVDEYETTMVLPFDPATIRAQFDGDGAFLGPKWTSTAQEVANELDDVELQNAFEELREMGTFGEACREIMTKILYHGQRP